MDREDYEAALNTQSACNMMALVAWWTEVLRKLHAQAETLTKGWDWAKHHPINRLVLEQLAFLNGVQHLEGGIEYAAADGFCRAMAQEERIVRYCGGVEIVIEMEETAHGATYRCHLYDGEGVRVTSVRSPQYLTGAIDSPASYDSVARAALAFVSDQEEISNVAMDESGYHIGRTLDTAWQPAVVEA